MCKGTNYAIGIGVAGAIIGLHLYCFSKPKYQRELQHGVQEVIDEFSSMVSDLNTKLRDHM